MRAKITSHKLSAINQWRILQGLEPLQSSGKTEKQRMSGALRRAHSNAAERAQANRDMKSNRQNTKRK